MSGVRMVYLDRMYEEIRDRVEPALLELLPTGRYVMGKPVEGLEQALAARYRFAHAAAVASGTDALVIALRAAGVMPGDEVVVPAFTIFVDGAVVRMLGALPQFAEVDAADFGLSPAGFEAAITPRTKAVIVVHLFGQCTDMDALRPIAQRHGVVVIEDACQAIGARYGDAYAGALGDLGCFSFYPTKNLGAAGDGGLLTARTSELFDEARLLRLHGVRAPEPYSQLVWGYNSRLDAIQALWLQAKLPFLEGWEARRRAIADHYRASITNGKVTLPRELAGRHHVWHQFTVRVTERDAFRRHLADAGIEHALFYPSILPDQPAYRDVRSQQHVRDWPVAEQLAREVVSIPVTPQLSDAEVDAVVSVVNAF